MEREIKPDWNHQFTDCQLQEIARRAKEMGIAYGFGSEFNNMSLYQLANLVQGRTDA